MLQVVFDKYERGSLKTIVRAETVIGITIPFDIGAIDCAPTAAVRKQLLGEMMGVSSAESCEEAAADAAVFWNCFASDYEILKRSAGEGVPVRMWYSSAAYSLCGFYSMIHALASCHTQITAVKLPELMDFWGEVKPEQWNTYLSLEQEVTKAEQRVIAQRWAALKQENAPLRASIGGRIHSVNESFYDEFIRQALAAPCNVSEVIIRVMERYRFGIGDWLIRNRLEQLLRGGRIRIVEKGEDFYNCVITQC